MLSEFELGHKVAEAAKNICFAKGVGAIDHRTVTRWLKKFLSGFKNFNDHARSSKPQTVDLEAVLQAVDAKQASCTRRVSGEFGISQASEAGHLNNLAQKYPKLINCASCCQNIAKLLTQTSIYTGPVGWGRRIHRLHLCRGKDLSPTSGLDMTRNNLMVRLQS